MYKIFLIILFCISVTALIISIIAFQKSKKDTFLLDSKTSSPSGKIPRDWRSPKNYQLFEHENIVFNRGPEHLKRQICRRNLARYHQEMKTAIYHRHHMNDMKAIHTTEHGKDGFYQHPTSKHHGQLWKKHPRHGIWELWVNHIPKQTIKHNEHIYNWMGTCDGGWGHDGHIDNFKKENVWDDIAI